MASQENYAPLLEELPETGTISHEELRKRLYVAGKGHWVRRIIQAVRAGVLYVGFPKGEDGKRVHVVSRLPIDRQPLG